MPILTSPGFVSTSPGLVFPTPRVVRTSPGLVKCYSTPCPAGQPKRTNHAAKAAVCWADTPFARVYIYVIFPPKKHSHLHTELISL